MAVSAHRDTGGGDDHAELNHGFAGDDLLPVTAVKIQVALELFAAPELDNKREAGARFAKYAATGTTPPASSPHACDIHPC